MNNVYTGSMNDSPRIDPLHQPPQQNWRRRLQPLLVVALTLMLHLMLFDWLSGRHGDAALKTPVEQVIIASLLPPPDVPAPIPAPIPPPVEATPKPVTPPRTPRPPINVARAAAVEPAEIQPLDEALAQAPPPQAMTDTPPIAIPELPKKAAAESTPQTAPALRFAPPPSAELKYDVQALRDGKTVYGSGKISWQTNGERYAIDGEAGVLFFSVLSFKSEGSLDQQGITPLRYSEKRLRKSETNTHFQRDPQRISFSASTQQYPRNGGEQDRASIIWQLAALGRADPAQFGSGLDIFVAGVRDGDTWHVQIVGEEQITVGGESITAWHLLRTPRADSFDAKVDIWLAPTRDWYPVKLRQTERNGDYLDMSMSSITRLSALTAQ